MSDRERYSDFAAKEASQPMSSQSRAEIYTKLALAAALSEIADALRGGSKVAEDRWVQPGSSVLD